jgi:hypothetical protein
MWGMKTRYVATGHLYRRQAGGGFQASKEKGGSPSNGCQKIIGWARIYGHEGNVMGNRSRGSFLIIAVDGPAGV